MDYRCAIATGSTVLVDGASELFTVTAFGERLSRISDFSGVEHLAETSSLVAARFFGDPVMPLLEPTGEIMNAPGAPVHQIINGENLHALEMLQYTHAGAIDLIYVDPPYNTGNKTWKYNDRYVAEKDSYRHSKWLSFMEKRLLLSKKLLAPAGVIFVSIDDNEQHRLRMLMDQIFGASNCLGQVAVVNNLKGRSDDKFFATAHESLIAFAKDSARATIGGFAMNDEQGAEYKLFDEIGRYKEVGLRKTGKTAKRADRPNMYYPVYFSPSTKVISLSPKADDDVIVWPHDSKGEHGRWRWGVDTFEAKKDTELVVRKAAGNWNVFVKMRDTVAGVERTRRPKSVWIDPKYDSGKGTAMLKDIFGDAEHFTNPKPIEFIMDLVRVGAPGERSVILDFFGGSGTTAEAVMRLNAEDGGTRQAILVTNNELAVADDKKLRAAGHKPGEAEYEALGVFHHVTRPRISTVITGIREDGSKYSDGLAANAAFFALRIAAPGD
jgi:adenine-specific DNA-methyltransferase